MTFPRYIEFTWPRAWKRASVRKNRSEIVVRTRDNVCADDFAVLACGLGTGFDSSLNGGYVSGNGRADQSTANALHRAGQFNVCSLEHGVRALHECHEAFGFEDSDCLFCHNECGF